MDKQAVLIVDDEADIRALLEITLGRMGLVTTAAANLAEARDALAREHFAFCLTDMRLPDGTGMDLVREIQARHDGLPVAVITAYGNTEDAVESLKSGAFDFVTKPVNLDVLRRLVDTALRMSGEARLTRPAGGPSRLVGDAPAIESLRKVIAKLARNQAPVHVCGESGTGKELVARMIHEQGPRAQRPFIPVNCGAVPAELMESEFFGHVKGSFTGANANRAGLFMAADGGTLFLDEVADLPLPMQVKLLRAIQERMIRPVGSNDEIPVDVRIISATHRNLREEVQAGRFREDLYYRLNVIEIHVPPLRERLEDLPPLTELLLQRIADRHGLPLPKLTAAAHRALQGYHFPGNVRELENILERAAALCDEQRIDADDLRLAPAQDPVAGEAPAAAAGAEAEAEAEDGSIDDTLAETERTRIVAALERARYNKTRAAKLLGISFRSLRYRVKKLGIE